MEYLTCDSIYALEVQQPFSTYLLQGKKTIETRAYPLPQALFNKELILLETSSNTSGQSLLSDEVHISTKISPSSVRAIGIICFKSCKQYLQYEQWDQDRLHHLVDYSSTYEWKDSDHNIPVISLPFIGDSNDKIDIIDTHPDIVTDNHYSQVTITNIHCSTDSSTTTNSNGEKYGWEIAYVKPIDIDCDDIIARRIYRSIFEVIYPSKISEVVIKKE